MLESQYTHAYRMADTNTSWVCITERINLFGQQRAYRQFWWVKWGITSCIPPSLSLSFSPSCFCFSFKHSETLSQSRAQKQHRILHGTQERGRGQGERDREEVPDTISDDMRLYVWNLTCTSGRLLRNLIRQAKGKRRQSLRSDLPRFFKLQKLRESFFSNLSYYIYFSACQIL